MRTIVLDDDPTGTQSAAGVRVLFDADAASLTEALRSEDSVWVQTNSRALDETTAVSLVAQIREAGIEAGRALGDDIRFVLRGDSTLRGHVFAESAVFLDADPDAVMLFAPAFPDGGRTTVCGVHRVEVDGVATPASETEYARDPVFPFASSDIGDYVREKSDREAIRVPLDEVRRSSEALAGVLVAAPPGGVVAPDAETNDDVRLIAQAVRLSEAGGRRVVVRSAAPLAAELAGAASTSLLGRPLAIPDGHVLVVCGSHTSGASAQLTHLAARIGTAVTVSTAAALADPETAATEAAQVASKLFDHNRVVALITERVRLSNDDTLWHGAQVMAALTRAVTLLAPAVAVVIAKGGITSDQVARVGLGAQSARVQGQLAPGVSVWTLDRSTAAEMTYVIVPGNVGSPDALTDALDAIGA